MVIKLGVLCGSIACFRFRAEGPLVLEFMVDPDNLVAETDEGNNRVTERIGGNIPRPGPDLGEVMCWLAGGSLIGWISAGLAMMALRRRPGRKDFNRCH